MNREALETIAREMREYKATHGKEHPLLVGWSERITAALGGEPKVERGEVLCYRMHTGDPPRSWSWMSGTPSPGVLELADRHGYHIEYAYAGVAP